MFAINLRDRGSFIRSYNSNLEVTNVTAENLSANKGAFLFAKSSISEKINISIEKSNFTNLIATSSGAVLYYEGSNNEKFDTINISDVVLSSNSAGDSGGAFFLNCNQSAKVTISNLQAENSTALNSASFASLNNCEGPISFVSLLDSTIKDSNSIYGFSTISVLNTSFDLSNSKFTNNRA